MNVFGEPEPPIALAARDANGPAEMVLTLAIMIMIKY